MPNPSKKTYPAIVEEFELPFNMAEMDYGDINVDGFVINWTTIKERKGIKAASIDRGIGDDSPWLRASITLEDGRIVLFQADIQPLLESLINRALEKYPVRMSRVCGSCGLSVVTTAIEPCENCKEVNWTNAKAI